MSPQVEMVPLTISLPKVSKVWAIKFLRTPIHTDYPCYMEADIKELLGAVGNLYLTCPLGQFVMENVTMWSGEPINGEPINGYYLFLSE